MDPGTRNAPGENDTAALSGGVACCHRPKSALTCSKRVDLPDMPPVCILERGE